MKTTSKQNLILLQLALNGPLVAGDFKFTIKPAQDRNPLVGQGLISQTKQGRSLRFELTDRGWAYLDDLTEIHLMKTQATAPLLEKFFGLTVKHLHQTGHPLASLKLPAAPTVEPDAPVPERRSIVDLIREAYTKLSIQQPGCEVRLKHLRAELSSCDRDTLDLCLMGLVMAGRGQLGQIDDALTLNADDYEAAIHLGGAARHLFRLTS